MSGGDGDTTSLDFGIYNNTGQSVTLTAQGNPNSHWHIGPPSSIADGGEAHVSAGSNSANGTNVTVEYTLADGTARFDCQALVPPSWASNRSTCDVYGSNSDAYQGVGDIGHGTLNVTGDWKFNQAN
jgi:hypothetical protein